MKKVTLNKKLQLNKETIANLNEKQMNEVKGGAAFTSGCTDSCTAGTICRKLSINLDCTIY